jgi:hypothetical protein
MNLPLLFVQQTHQFVVLLNRLHRLHKHRLTRRRRPMHHARHLALELRLHRNHKPLAANRNQIVLRTSAIAQSAQRPPQTLFNRTMLPLHRTANPPQLRRSIVIQRTIRLDLSAQHP